MVGLKKICLVIGATRGLGRRVSLTLAENGYKVGIAGKTAIETPGLPGTIYSVKDEIVCSGGVAEAIHCNVVNSQAINDAVATCITDFGGLDSVIYNAGAITWDPVKNTSLKRFDLLWNVNIRGAYALIESVLPHFLEQKNGKIILVSPPIYSRFFKGKVPYAVTKVGMSVLANGLAHELKDTGVSVSCIWPATVIESHVTTVKNVSPEMMRKPEIFADACLEILKKPTSRYNGQTLIDEDLLRSLGVKDFAKYRCDPEKEPPRMMPAEFPSLLVEEEDQSINFK